MKRRLSLLLLMTTPMMGCHAPSSPPTPAASLPTAQVRTGIASRQARAGREEVVGTVRAKLRATLEAKVSGRITKMPVKLGEMVKKGQLIAQLDAQDIRAKLRQAEAVSRQASAEYKRFAALVKQQAVTQSEFDQVNARYQVALASVREARSMLSYATVTAPFAGMITHKLADRGDLSSPGRPLVELEDPDALRLEVAVPEALMSYVKVGRAVPVSIAAVTAPMDGTVSEMAPSADPNSRTFLVKIDLPQSEALRPGQFGRAQITTGRSQILKIPRSAIVKRGQMELAFVVEDGKALLRLVKTGKAFAADVEVVSGLEDGETIVIDGAAGLSDGQPVEVLK